MYVCVAGKNNIAVDVLIYLIENNNDRYELCVICNDSRTEIVGFQKSLSQCAKEHGIPIVSLSDVYEYEDLIFLSMEFDKIIRPDKFTDARLFNIHFSLLPAYKGMYTSAIPILNGERYTGVTFHRIDAGIDTGDIIDQKKIKISDDDTCRDLYIKYLQEGAKLVLENIEIVLRKEEKSKIQPAYGASYYPVGYINYENLKINFRDVAISVNRQIRAYSFREYQLPSFNNTKIISSKITDEKSVAKPGSVLFEDEICFVISTIDYNIILYKDRFDELLLDCEKGIYKGVEEICQVKEHINTCNRVGWTPLIVATYNNQYEIAEYLIDKGANVFISNYHGTNLLMYAKEVFKRYGDRNLFDLYISKGLDVNKKDDYGNSLLDYIEIERIEGLL